jgi:membrane protein required for colicin V production
MQFQILDFILAGIMLLSGILALARGFTREVLSLVAWILAALAAYFAIQQQQLVDLALPYVDRPILAQIAVGAIAFIVTLVIVSVFSVRISDRVVDSSVGAFDRTLGLIYGLARGLAFVGIAYLFYSGWLQPKDRQEDWIRNAQALPLIQSTSELILAAIARISPDAADTLRTGTISNAQGAVTAPEGSDTTYNSGQTQGLGTLIEGQQAPVEAPAQGTTQP